jgi:superfamily II DNA or RNA helicase
VPCLSNACRYDRAVAYFRSSIYIIAWEALTQFLRNDGRIRIVCSPALSPADVVAIENGYEKRDSDAFAKALQEEIEQLLVNPIYSDATRVLGALVANGFLDIKIAVIDDKSICIDSSRLFHSKIGLFYDRADNCIVFKGSMNETWNGLSNDGNIETIDVFVDWTSGRDAERVRENQNYFRDLWENQALGVRVTPFPEIAKETLIKAAADNWHDLIDKISTEIRSANSTKSQRRKILPHQSIALRNWESQNRRGILEHATGSGKTFTALCAIEDALNKSEKPIIIVPSQLLLIQWEKELKEMFSGHQVEILCCGAGHVKWRTENLLGTWTRRSNRKRCVVTTSTTAASEEFRSRINQGNHIFIVGDEVHRLGSEDNRSILTIQSGPRLGLSATPRRAGDPGGTQAIFDYFGPIVNPAYTLQDALNDGRLTPYSYRIHTVDLTDEEHEKWLEITSRIMRFAGQNHVKPDVEVLRRLKFALIERSRIIKAAEKKVLLASSVLEQQYRSGDRWIVYCDSLVQLRNVMSIVSARGLAPLEYHSSMKGDPKSTLRYFDEHGGIIVSIKCLDEGIDIPSVTHALILASSSNPREFIQRRGRVLRKFPGKYLSHIHDALVIPRYSDNEIEGASILISELARALEFSRSAINKIVLSDIESVASRFKINIDQFKDGGVEDEQSEGD